MAHLVNSYRLPLVSDPGYQTGLRGVKWASCLHFGWTTPQKTHYRLQRDVCHLQSELTYFCRLLDEFYLLCVVFIQSEGEIVYRHTVVFQSTSKTKMLGQKPPSCLDKDLRTSLSQPLFFHSSFSRVVVRVLALFGRLPLPWCRSRQAFPSTQNLLLLLGK